MPRILAPSSSSCRRGSNTSIRSQSSWGSYGSSRSLRYQQSIQNAQSPYRRSSVRKSQIDDTMDWPELPPGYHAVQDRSSTSNPPSLASSEVSVQSDMIPSLSRLSLSSHPCEQSPVTGRRHDERASQPVYPSSRPTVQRASSQSNQKSFLPSFQSVEEDTWGQFVDVMDEDERLNRQLARQGRLLSMSRHAAGAMHANSCPR